jgi:hypothetical protein
MIPREYFLEAIAACMLVTLVVPVCLTARTTDQIYDLKLVWKRYGRSTWVAVILAGSSFTLHKFEHFPNTAAQRGILEVGGRYISSRHIQTRLAVVESLERS